MHSQEAAEGPPNTAKDSRRERKFVRYRVGLFCQFSSDHSSGEGEVVDLSTGGCKIQSDVPFPMGEYLGMTFPSLVPDRPIGIELAVVRWSRDHAFGVEFIRMEPVQQERLRLLMHYLQKDASM